MRPEDLQQSFGKLGYVVTGAFYERPESLRSQVRALLPALHKKALEALDKALALAQKAKANLALIHASFGIARLLDPRGTQPEEARSYLRQAATESAADPNITPKAKAAILINAGVAAGAAGDAAEFEQRLVEAENVVTAWQEARDYNRTLLLAESADKQKRQQAVDRLASFLGTASHSSLWWETAYSRYARVAAEMGLTVKPAQAFAHSAGADVRYRPLEHLELPQGVVTLSERVGDVMLRLGQPAGHAVPGSNGIQRLLYPQFGISLLATDNVLAIFLSGPYAPSLSIQEKSPGAGGGGALKVGMSGAEVTRVLGGVPGEDALPFGDGSHYTCYSSLGLAIRYAKTGGKQFVEELVILPRTRQD